MVQQRDESLSKASRRTMAQLLDAGKYDSARIRVENIIRSDVLTELHELLELYCELLLARSGLLESSSQCDPGLEEAVKSIIYAAPKTEIKELHVVRTMLAEKFGKEFTLQAVENSDGKVSEKVVRKLSVTPPAEELVQGYLKEIASAYGVDWPHEEVEEEGEQNRAAADLIDNETDDLLGGGDDASGGEGGLEEALIPVSMQDLMCLESAGGDGKPHHSSCNKPTNTRTSIPQRQDEEEEGQELQPMKKAPVIVNPPSPSTENPQPRVTLNHVELKPPPATAKKRMAEAGLASNSSTSPKPKPSSTEHTSPEQEKLDELARRFAALKQP